MALNIEKMRSEMAWEARKFLVSTVLAAAALMGAGVAIGNYLGRQPPPPPPAAPQVIFQPGAIVVAPAAPPSPMK